MDMKAGSKPRSALCIYPYRTELGEYGFCPPLGLEYVAASLEPLVGRITIVDMRFEKDLTEFVDDDTDLVCISKNWAFEEEVLSEVLRGIPKHIPVIVGGRDATENVDELFQSHPTIDMVVRGDGEETMRELLEKGSPGDVAGLSYRDNGTVVHNEVRDFAPVNNTIYPDRRNRRYTYRFVPQGFDLRTEMDTICSSLGCPFKCKFCTFNMNPYGAKRRWSPRSPESVVDEIKTINAELIFFVDDNFTHDMNRVEKICHLILEEGIKKKFVANARIDIFKRPDVLAKMEEAGFKFFLLGLESSCDETLKFLNKGFTVAQVREAFRVLKRFNILYHGYFIIGNIGESEADMLSISQFARQVGVDTITLNRLRADKYSPLREFLANAEGYHIGKRGEVHSDRYSPERLMQISRKVNRRFYSFIHTLRLLRKLSAHGMITVGLGYRIFQWIRYIKAHRGLQTVGESL